VSVINQVLQDLEKRHARNDEARTPATQIRAVGSAPRASGRRLAIAVLVLIAVGAAVFLWRWWSQEKPAPAPLATPPAPAKPVAALSTPAEAPLPPAPAVPEKPPAAAPAVAARAPVAPKPIEEPGAKASATARATPIASGTPPKAKPTPAPKALAEDPAPAGGNGIEKRERPLSAAERAEAQFRLGAQSMQQGRMRDAEASFLAAIAEDPGHVPSRQALLGIYLEAQRRDEAEVLLRDGLKASPRPPAWAMVLARLEAERGDIIGGINTMQNHLDVGRQNGDYLALFAALLQKQGRHPDAVEQYQAAINLGQGKAVWLMGQGISLRELGKREEARAAFQRALDSGGLSADLKLFVERQISALRQAAN
jgi:MSHA biogenesis protein MshN